MRKLYPLLIAALLVSAIGALQSPVPVRAVSGSLSFTPSFVSFGSITVGTRSKPVDVIVKNTGTVNVTLGRLTIAGEFKLKIGTCTIGVVLMPTQTCTFSVIFAPLSIASKTGTVSIPSDATNPLYTINMSGTGSGTNLLKSANFDLPLTKPIPWREGPNVPDILDLLDCSVWISPMCSVRMQGRLDLYGNPLLQTISQGVARVGAVGDKYTFVLSSKSSAVPLTGLYSVQVILLNTYNQVVGRQVVNFRHGTHTWQTVVGNITATETHTWVVFRIIFRQASGRAWFDNAILVKVP